MKTVYKYGLPMNDVAEFMMPIGAEILHIAEQDGNPCMWALVDPIATNELFRVRVAGTGHQIHEDDLEHLGTFFLQGGSLVFHVFKIPTG